MRYGAEQEFFRLAEGAVPRRSAKAVAYAGTYGELSGERAETGTVVLSFVLEVTAAELL